MLQKLTKIACLALAVFIGSSCTPTLNSSEVISIQPVQQCSEKHTVSRARYDKMIFQFSQRADVRNPERLSQQTLEDNWLNSAQMISLFENLKACVLEANGLITIKVWSKKSFDAEVERYRILSSVIFGKSEKRNNTPAPLAEVPPKNHSGVSSEESLQKLVSKLVDEAVRDQKTQLEVTQLQVSVRPVNHSNEELLAMTEKYYRDNFELLKPTIIQSLVTYTKNFTSQGAQIQYAHEARSLTPVLEYFRVKYSQDLSDVVVISAPISSIPHVGTSIFGSALGLFISPRAVPIGISFRLPLNKLDATLSSGSISGNIHIKFNNSEDILLSSMRQFFKSYKLIHIDPRRIAASGVGAVGFEAVVAHEMRHLIDHFNCAKQPSDVCNEDRVKADWDATIQEARERQERNYQAYLASPDTRTTKSELVKLHQKYRPALGSSEQIAWADTAVKQFFDANYTATYPLYFSMKERRGYREQLSYLVQSGQSKAQAVQTVLRTSAPERFSIQMDQVTESIHTPGRPWIDQLLLELLQ